MLKPKLSYVEHKIRSENSDGTDLMLGRVAEWLWAWDTLTMFEATVCGRS